MDSSLRGGGSAVSVSSGNHVSPAALLLVLTLRLELAEPPPSGHYWLSGQREKQDAEGLNGP